MGTNNKSARAENLYEAIAQALQDEGLGVGPGLLTEQVARLWVDAGSGNVWVERRPIEPLTKLEYRLLLLLYENENKICNKYKIVEEVWGEYYTDQVDDSRIEKLVSRLRRKIEPDPAHPQFIITVRGRGYRLRSKAGGAP